MNKFCLKKWSRLIKALDNRFYVKFMQLQMGLLPCNPCDYLHKRTESLAEVHGKSSTNNFGKYGNVFKLLQF